MRLGRSATILLVLALAAHVGGAPARSPSIHDELVERERQDGLAIASYYVNLGVVLFDQRKQISLGMIAPPPTSTFAAISPDGTFLALGKNEGRDAMALFRIDSGEGRTFGFSASPSCWSHDGKFVAAEKRVRTTSPDLRIVELSSGGVTIVRRDAEYATPFSAQCFSPDDSQVVFEQDAKVYVFDRASQSAREVAAGRDPSWTPDGTEIAYRIDGAYYAIPLSGGAARLLFHRRRAFGALSWSPDGKFVAYNTGDPVFRNITDEDVHLRVRRVADGAEEIVATVWTLGSPCVWVENRDLVSRAVKISAAKAR
jgi:Tol biopolymer transport system component